MNLHNQQLTVRIFYFECRRAGASPRSMFFGLDLSAKLIIVCSGRAHYSQVKLKTLLSMSNFTHFLPRYQLKYDSICSFIIEKKLFGTSLSSRERRNN